MANRSAQSRNHARGVNVGSSGLLCIRRGSNSSAENAARKEGQKNRASPVRPEILTLWLVVRFLSTCFVSCPGWGIRYNRASDPDKSPLDGLSEKLCSSPPLSQFTQKFTDHNFLERGMPWNSYAYRRLDRFVRPQSAATIVVEVKPSAAASTSSATKSTISSEKSTSALRRRRRALVSGCWQRKSACRIGL